MDAGIIFWFFSQISENIFEFVFPKQTIKLNRWTEQNFLAVRFLFLNITTRLQ